MELDLAEIADRLRIDLDELERIINELVEAEIRMVLDDMADDSHLSMIFVRLGEDNILDAARQAVARWVRRLR